MPNSMTGFASHLVVAETNEFNWEIRSVNHRYLDVSLRLPEDWRRLETACRELAAKFVSRGKIDCALRIAPHADGPQRPQLDEQVMANVRALQEKVISEFPDARELSVAEVLRFDGVVIDPQLVSDVEAVETALLGGLSTALAALVDARSAEGGRIAEFLLQRVAAIESAIEQAGPLLESAGQRYRSKLLQRVERLDIEAEPERLEQELAVIAQRMDITEELDRLSSHCAEIRAVLKRNEPIGRRLDFLIQELNREANTMTSKSQDEELTRISVDLKVVIEQMREQVQNLE